MINIKVNECRSECEIKGNIHTLIPEAAIMLSAIYHGIKEEDALAAYIFRGYFESEIKKIFEGADQSVKDKKTTVTDLTSDNLYDDLGEILNKLAGDDDED
jgi:hypothetical protein